MSYLLRFLLLCFFCIPGIGVKAQAFRIGSIDVYGNRTVNKDSVLAHLPVKEGDSISRDNFNTAEVANIIKQIPGVKYCMVSPVCCDTSGNLMLYVGVGETDDVQLKFRKAPVARVQLPDEMINSYRNFTHQLDEAVQRGEVHEEDSNGYALNESALVLAEQRKFISYANEQLPIIIRVLTAAGDPEQRAAAAQILAYSANRKKAITYLLYAVTDENEEVRNNASRAISILAGYIRRHPDEKLYISPDPFINMLNSIVWTDRNKAASVLMELTALRDRKMLNLIKEKALPSVMEMAQWKDRGHAFFSYFILGRIAGISEDRLAATCDSPKWRKEIENMKQLIH